MKRLFLVLAYVLACGGMVLAQESEFSGGGGGGGVSTAGGSGTANVLPKFSSATSLSDSFFIQGGDATNARFVFNSAAATHPMFRRNSTAVEVKLADNSAFAPLSLSTLVLNGATSGTATVAAAATTTSWTLTLPSAVPATANSLLKISGAGAGGYSLLSDDGTNVTLTSGQFLGPTSASYSAPTFASSAQPDSGITIGATGTTALVANGYPMLEGNGTQYLALSPASGANIAFHKNYATPGGVTVGAFAPDSSAVILGSSSGLSRFRHLYLGGTITSDAPALDIAQTWNNGAATFTAAKVNVTDTTSAAASKLLDLQVGGVSKFYVIKSGAVTIADNLTISNGQLLLPVGSESAPSISFTGDTNCGWYTGGNDRMYLTLSGATRSGWRDYSFFVGAPTWGSATLSVGGDPNISAAPPSLIYTHSGDYSFLIRGHNTPTGFTDIAGGPLILSSGLGCGNGLSGSIIFQTSNPGASGSTVNTPVERLRILPAGHLRLPELTSNPSLSDLTSLAHVVEYMKGDKLVFAYNNGGVMTYLSIPLDGVTTTWTHSTTAP